VEELSITYCYVTGINKIVRRGTFHIVCEVQGSTRLGPLIYEIIYPLG